MKEIIDTKAECIQYILEGMDSSYKRGYFNPNGSMKLKMFESDLTNALTTIYNKGKEDERKRIVDMVKTTKEAYMYPSTEERFINDINQ